MTGRPRSFDYAEARRLRAEGLTYREIGARLGVSKNAARCACDDGYRERQNAAARAYSEARRFPCFGGCGTLVWETFRAGRSGFCRVCYAERFRRREQHGTESEYKAGCRCGECTRATSDAKRARRVRSRVPCSSCGTPVDSINRRQPGKPPECRPCAARRIRAERRTA